MRKFSVAGLVAVAGALALPAFAGQVEYRPAADVITQSPRACPARFDTLPVPVITWGADIATVHAAGLSQRPIGGGEGSLFAQNGVNVDLYIQNDPTQQVRDFLDCKTPLLRMTLGMAAAFADVLQANPGKEAIPLVRLSWSAGGDTIVANARQVRQMGDLAGKRIGLQAYGPHMDYLATVLADADLRFDDVEIVWYEGLSDAADGLRDGEVDVAFAILPDALTLTSNGLGGTGAEGSVRDANIRLTTREANRVIADLYLVRADYLAANADQMIAFANALFRAAEEVPAMMPDAGILEENDPDAAYAAAIREKGGDAQALVDAAVDVLSDASTPLTVLDIVGLWADQEIAGYGGNVSFFADTSNPRNATNLFDDVQYLYTDAGWLQRTHEFPTAFELGAIDYGSTALTAGLSSTAIAAAPTLTAEDQAQLQTQITNLRTTGQLNEFTPFKSEILFEENQSSFPRRTYAAAFEQVLDRLFTYEGAVMVCEGHVDPTLYVQNVEQGTPVYMLRAQEGRVLELSEQRCREVVSAIVEYAKAKGIQLSESRFVVQGLGYTQPLKGMCNVAGSNVPCKPANASEQAAERRAVFRVVSIAAE